MSTQTAAPTWPSPTSTRTTCRCCSTQPRRPQQHRRPPTPTPVVTPTPAPTPIPTPVAGMATTTKLNVAQVPLPLGLGGFAFPTAHVSPLTAAGTVQFKDGTTNLGAPVRVIASTAIGPFTQLSPGPHSLTAVFSPTNPTQFNPPPTPSPSKPPPGPGRTTTPHYAPGHHAITAPPCPPTTGRQGARGCPDGDRQAVYPVVTRSFARRGQPPMSSSTGHGPYLQTAKL